MAARETIDEDIAALGVRMDERHDPNGLIRRAVRSWWDAKKAGLQAIPRPEDDPVAHADGPDADRILFVGDGPAMGLGVRSHDLALPGHLARQISRLTGRGARVQLIADPHTSTDTVLDQYRAHAGDGHRALLVLFGTVDAMRLTPAEEFRDRFDALLDQATCDGVRRILVLGVPPFSAMPIVSGFPARLAHDHARVIDSVLRDAADRRIHARYLPFAPPAEPEPDRYRSAATYRVWASLVSPDLAGLLNEVAREDGRSVPVAVDAMS